MSNKFLGLPVEKQVGLYKMIRNWLSIVLFTGIWYFLTAMFIGFIQNDIWKYVQSIEKYYFVQFIILTLGVIFGHFTRVGLNIIGDRFFIYKRVDLIFYIIGFILTYFIINELFGL